MFFYAVGFALTLKIAANAAALASRLARANAIALRSTNHHGDILLRCNQRLQRRLAIESLLRFRGSSLAGLRHLPRLVFTNPR